MSTTNHETLNPPSAAAQRLPVEPTPVSSSRAHFPDTSNNRQWNFLRGEGPSSSAQYYAEEKSAWKPGWQAMKRQEVIQQDKARVQHTEFKEQRNAVVHEMRAERITEWQSYNKFNPITGQEKTPVGWQPASNPWQHQKQGLRPATTISSMEPKPDPAVRAANQSQMYEMRKARIASDGLSKRTGGTAADAMRWS